MPGPLLTALKNGHMHSRHNCQLRPYRILFANNTCSRAALLASTCSAAEACCTAGLLDASPGAGRFFSPQHTTCQPASDGKQINGGFDIAAHKDIAECRPVVGFQWGSDGNAIASAWNTFRCHAPDGNRIIHWQFQQQFEPPALHVHGIVALAARTAPLFSLRQAMQLLNRFQFPAKRWFDKVGSLSGGELRRLQLLTVCVPLNHLMWCVVWCGVVCRRCCCQTDR